VLAVICLLVGFLCLAVEHRFRWLAMTGRRGEAQITLRQEHIVGYAYTRRSAAAGQAFPLIETQFHFVLTDDGGGERRGSFRVSGTSEAFQVGESVGIMYPRFGDGAGQPSDWGFYACQDAAWFTFTLVGAVCLVTVAGCWWGRSRVWDHNATGETLAQTEALPSSGT